MQVVGDILCNTVMVLNGGKVLGDITAVNLTVGPKVGAILVCRMAEITPPFYFIL